MSVSGDDIVGADIIYDGSGARNCFAGNRFRTQFPDGITALFPCP
jgi:hypothetical protein